MNPNTLTLIVALVSSVAILCLRPVKGLVLYIALIAWYPSYLSVQIGSLDFTVCRIVILAVYAKLFLRLDQLKHFRFIWLDWMIIIYFIAQVISGMTTTEIAVLLENRAGAVFDMVLPYFAVRMIIRSKAQYITLLKGILIVAAPLAILGLMQCLTGKNPLSVLIPNTTGLAVRKGFYRAELSFSVSIMFGLFFAMLGPACAGIWYSLRQDKRILFGIMIGLIVVGTFSSMSSGPILALFLSILFIVFYKFRHSWKTIMWVVLVMCLIVEVISNRHFYDVLGGFTLNPATAWYRSMLIEVALFKGGMSGHWIAGYGFADPGWSMYIDNRDHTDMVNHYLLVLCRYGLIGLIPFMAIVVLVFREIIKAFRLCRSERDKWLTWCLAGALFGLFVSLVSVSLFGPPKTMLYLLFGFSGVMPIVIRETNLRRKKLRRTSPAPRYAPYVPELIPRPR